MFYYKLWIRDSGETKKYFYTLLAQNSNFERQQAAGDLAFPPWIYYKIGTILVYYQM